MTLATGRTLGDIAPGEVREIGIMLAPGTDVDARVYDDKITIYSDNSTPMDYYVQVTVTSDNRGGALFDVLNEFYEDVAGASIVVQHDRIYELTYSLNTAADGTIRLAGQSTDNTAYALGCAK